MRIVLAIFISLMIHIFLKWGASFIPVEPPRPHDVEVTLIENSQIETTPAKIKKPIQQFVRDTNVFSENIKEKKQARFKSREDRQVEEEVQASRSGLTQNNLKDLNLDKELQGDLFRGGPSAVGEKLPNDIKVGRFTALNTEKYTYYSFFSRIEELIRFGWEQSVELAIQNLQGSPLPYNRNDEWVTQVEILLDAKGEFQAGQILKGSGIASFDRAAISSFAQARMFPNPPKDLVEKDQMIRLKYAFYVKFKPRVIGIR